MQCLQKHLLTRYVIYHDLPEQPLSVFSDLAGCQKLHLWCTRSALLGEVQAQNLLGFKRDTRIRAVHVTVYSALTSPLLAFSCFVQYDELGRMNRLGKPTVHQCCPLQGGLMQVSHVTPNLSTDLPTNEFCDIVLRPRCHPGQDKYYSLVSSNANWLVLLFAEENVSASVKITWQLPCCPHWPYLKLNKPKHPNDAVLAITNLTLVKWHCLFFKADKQDRRNNSSSSLSLYQNSNW